MHLFNSTFCKGEETAISSSYQVLTSVATSSGEDSSSAMSREEASGQTSLAVAGTGEVMGL